MLSPVETDGCEPRVTFVGLNEPGGVRTGRGGSALGQQIATRL
jgi:hypothetical protein